MHFILTIFKKEFKELLRDRRTLFAMIIFPLILAPMIILVMTKITASQTKTAQFKSLKVAVVDNGNGADILKRLNRRKDISVINNMAQTDFNHWIKEDSIDLALVIDPEFDQAIHDGRTGQLRIHYNATSDTIIYQRLEKTIRRYQDEILAQRLEEMDATLQTIHPIQVTAENVYTTTQSIGKMTGGLLPYFFVLFAFIGAMYPSIDLFTGEKERGTIETILTVPASRLQILLGKMLVIIFSGTLSAMLTIGGLFLALQLHPQIPQVVLNMAYQLLHPEVLLLILLMIIPLTTFFAGMLIPICIYGKSFKEAQSMIQPMLVLIILPLVVGTLPGIELNMWTAMIPVLNIALASKEIVAGTIDYGLLAIVFVALFAFAAMGIALAIHWFAKESNVLRI